MTRKPSSDKALLYRSLEEQAKPYLVRAIRLIGKGTEPLGLLLIDNDRSAEEAAAALAGLRLSDQGRQTTGGTNDGKLPDQAWLRQQLAMELAQVQQTRLPCSLLLITVFGKVSAEQAATALAPCLHPRDALSGFHKNGLALLMPGATVGKARKRAEEIRDILRNGACGKGANLALGIAVCHAYETMAPDQFFALAETELARAAKQGKDAICQSAAARAEDSCQVTVEERGLLWQMPRKTTRATRIAV